MIISKDAENTYEKIQHLFIRKILNKVDVKGRHLNIIKSTYDKPTANITLNSEKLNIGLEVLT